MLADVSVICVMRIHIHYFTGSISILFTKPGAAVSDEQSLCVNDWIALERKLYNLNSGNTVLWLAGFLYIFFKLFNYCTLPYCDGTSLSSKGAFII
jgi:hypothetical protein